MKRCTIVAIAAGAVPTLAFPAHASAQSAAPSGETASARLAALVPAGMSTREACDGFDIVKECAAALHAAQNLDIPFPQLKSKLTGGLPLSLAIHDLKPDADAAAEARKAEAQANSDLRARPWG
jgi:hypothetical protein